MCPGQGWKIVFNFWDQRNLGKKFLQEPGISKEYPIFAGDEGPVI